MSPDLAREIHHRSFAVGAGHCRHGVRLAAIEKGRHQGKTATRIVVGKQQRMTVLKHRAMGRQHRHSTLRQSLIDEIAAVLPVAGQCGK